MEEVEDGWVVRYRWLLAAGALALVFLVSTRALVLGQAALLWDADAFFGPWFTLIADHARAGKLLWWNPYLSGGGPHYVDNGIGARSPWLIAFAFLTGGSAGGFVFYTLVTWLLGGMGMIVLSRHMKAPVWAAFIAAAGYIFSGFFLGQAQHTSHMQSLAWLPWIMWRIDAGVGRQRFRPIAEAAALWGLAFLAGYHGLTAWTGCYAAAWVIGRTAFPSQRDRHHHHHDTDVRQRAIFAAASLTMFLALGLVITLPGVVGLAVETRGYSDTIGTQPLDRSTLLSNPLPAGALATVASPYLASLKLHNRDLWPSTDVAMAGVYFSGAAMVLAILGVALRAAHAWRWWLVGMGVFFLALALAEDIALRNWLYDLFPPSRYFRHPSEARAYTLFTLSVLAAYGGRTLGHVDTRQAATVGGVTAIVVALLYAAIFEGTISSVHHPGTAAAAARIHVWVASGLLAAAGLLALIMHARAVRHLAIILSVAAGIDAIVAVDLCRTLYTRDEVHLARKQASSQSHRSGLDLLKTGLARKPRFMAVDYLSNGNLAPKVPVFFGYDSLANRFHKAWAHDPTLRPMVLPPQRMWFSPAPPELPPSDQLLEAIQERARRTGELLVICHSPSRMLDLGRREMADAEVEQATSAPPAEHVEVEYLKYTPNELAFRTTCPADGWLLVTDRWSPSWSATVNDAQVPVLGANLIFRAVPVSAGPNVVRFAFRPTGYPWLVVLSWTTMLGIAGWSGYRRYRPEAAREEKKHRHRRHRHRH